MTAPAPRPQPSTEPLTFLRLSSIIVAKEGTKVEAIEYLQKQWNDTCTLKARTEERTEALRIFADDESWFLNGRRDSNSSNFEGQIIARAALQKDAKP
jgi:hypothetical protein